MKGAIGKVEQQASDLAMRAQADAEQAIAARAALEREHTALCQRVEVRGRLAVPGGRDGASAAALAAAVTAALASRACLPTCLPAAPAAAWPAPPLPAQPLPRR
jgi:hypothetical protein